MPSDFLAKPGAHFKLAERPTRVDVFENKTAAKEAIKDNAKAISELAHRLYGEADRKLLIVLQGMDTSGKDGTTKAMFHRTPPLNVNHYEDVLVVKVKNYASPETIEQRYAQINDFERLLVESGTTILKFMLHISPEVQGERLRDRLVNPNKRWKFNPGDLDDRALWPDFMDAYETMVQRTSTEHAPWHIIPSDSRSTRGAIISGIVRATLEKMNPQYPDPGYRPEDFDIV